MLKTGHLLLVAIVGLQVNLIGAMDQELSKKRTIVQAQETNTVTQEVEDALPAELPVCPPPPRKKQRKNPRSEQQGGPVRELFPTLTAQDAENVPASERVAPMVYNNPYFGNADTSKSNTASVSLAMLVALNSVDQVQDLLTVYPHLVHHKDTQGDTQLHKAIRNGPAWYAMLLCQRGAHVREPNDAGETPLALAERLFHAIVPFLRQYHLPQTAIAY